MPKKHRVKRMQYVEHLRQLEKQADEKKKQQEERKRDRQNNKDDDDHAKVVAKPTAQTATAKPVRTEQGETSIKKVRTER